MRSTLLVLTWLCACDGAPTDVPLDAAPAADVPEADVPGIDAPRREGGLDAGAPVVGCSGADFLFCEDFESAAPGTLPAGWTVGFGWQMEDSDPEVSEAVAHGGRRALRSAIAISGQRRAEHSLEALGAARGTHWGRVFYYVESSAFRPSSGVVHNTMLALLNDTDEARVVDTVIGSWDDHPHQFLYNIPDDSCCTGSSYDYHTYDGAWHCAEWRVDAAVQSYRFFVDGTEVGDIAFDHGAGDGSAHMTDFRAVALGWRNYQTPDRAYVSYFDDLAIDDARIGCD